MQWFACSLCQNTYFYFETDRIDKAAVTEAAIPKFHPASSIQPVKIVCTRQLGIPRSVSHKELFFYPFLSVLHGHTTTRESDGSCFPLTNSALLTCVSVYDFYAFRPKKSFLLWLACSFMHALCDTHKLFKQLSIWYALVAAHALQ